MVPPPMVRWVGKVAIVTGASAGIGARIVEDLVKNGLKVVGLARRSERIEEISKKLSNEKGNLYALKTDVQKEDDILNAFKWTTENVEPVSILINNAGVIQQTSLIDGDTEKWKRVLDTNVLGLCIATREAVKIMRSNNIDGHIIHINSIAGRTVPKVIAINNVYAGSKHAVTALTETLRLELNNIGSRIKISSISPGNVETEILKTNNIAINKKFVAAKAAIPQLRAQDISDAVLYVLSTPLHVQVQELLIKPLGESI